MIANRISYHLDLLGPSVPVDTACSSSLTATHLAVQAIRNGDCESAVVAGIQLNHRLVDWMQYSQGGILSADGKCKPFDEDADGFSRGEAGVAIVLKRLDKAIQDRDHIYATILGTGINSTGAAAPVNAPVATAQRDAMLRAWSQTGRNPQDVDFIEVHATGTAAGDPTEANWVGETFYRSDELLIGSVKGNIGTGIIPPNVNLLNPNPRIRWEDYMLNVPTTPVPLRCRSQTGKSLIALCGSGIGGANGHVVLESPPEFSRPFNESPSNRRSPYTLFMAGGLSPRSATVITQDIQNLIVEYPDHDSLDFLSMTYGRRSRQLTWRSFAVHSSESNPPTELLKFSPPNLSPREKPPVIFVFAGQGPQHFEMGRQLFDFYPAFRRSILEMDQMYTQITGSSLIATTGLFQKNIITNDQYPIKLGDIWPIDITLPAIAMLQCALTDLLAHIGIVPDVLIGHSAGETAVLYASGAGSKFTTLSLAVARGKAMALLETKGGTMAALSCGVDEARQLLKEALTEEDITHVDIGCHNSQDAVTLSGLSSSIDKVMDVAEKRGILARKLRTHIPVHSKMMEYCREEFTRGVDKVWEARDIQITTPRIPVYSTTTGDLFEKAFDPSYFWDGTRGPVLFTEAMTSLLKRYPSAISLEVSPHPVLSSYLSSLGVTTTVSCLKRAKKSESEAYQFLTAVGQLVTSGVNSVDFSALTSSHPQYQPEIRLPSYPFNPKSISYHAEAPSYYRQSEPRHGALNFPGLRINSQTHPVLAQHVIKGEPIMPAAGFIEMALEYGANTLWDITFNSMLSLSHESPIPVDIKLDGPRWSIRTSTASGYRKHDSERFDRIHAEGFLSVETAGEKGAQVNLQNIKRRCKQVDLTDFYDGLKYFADYGPSFQRVIDAHEGDNEVLILIRGDDDLLPTDGYVFHPAILDCCLHFMVHRAFTLNYDPNVYYLPSKVKRIVLYPDFYEHGIPDVLYTHLVFKEWTPNTIVGDFLITTIDGTTLCSLTGVEVERHESAPTKVEQRYDLIMQPCSLVDRTQTEEDNVIRQNMPSRDLRPLYRYMDAVACKVSKETLEKKLSVGSTPDRQRYLNCLQSMIGRYNLEMPTDKEFVQFQNAWPDVMEVTNRVASVQEKILQSSKAAVAELFRDDILTRFYENYSWASEACALRVSSLIDLLAQEGKRIIRILEVGAGTGALSRQLSKVFANHPSLTIEYFVTDVSKELLPSVSHPNCRFSSLNISEDPSSQGFTPGSFDIVTAFHVIHAVPDLALALNSLNQLLVPGGSLIFGDLRGDSWSTYEPGTFWFDYVFGSFSEWFSFQDGRTHCTMSITDWEKGLEHAGFHNFSSETYDHDPLLFTLEAQKHVSTAIVHDHTQEPISFHYQRGKEEDLRQLLLANDGSEFSLWLYAESGLNGDAGVGLCRSLNKEYPLCKTYIAIFDGPEWTTETMSVFVRTITMGDDFVFYVDRDGRVTVPRLITSPTPTKRSHFDVNGSWKLDQGGFKMTSLQRLEPDTVIVKASAFSTPLNGMRAFVGHCKSVGEQSAFAEGNLVLGVLHSSDILNTFTIKDTFIIKLNPKLQSLLPNIVGNILPLLVAYIGCGSSFLNRKMVKSSRRILLTHDEINTNSTLRWYFDNLGYHVTEWNPKSFPLANLHDSAIEADAILSGTTQDNLKKMLKMSRSSRKTRRFFWNDPEEGLYAIARDDPTIVSESLWEILSHVNGKWNNAPQMEIIKMENLAVPPQGDLVSSDSTLFNSSKAYILIGGIGGVGIRVALWMYQKGARHLILTSRSGTESLRRVQDRLALRIIDYLRTLPDLKLQLVASDATSRMETTSLLESITAPLGGCMLLSVTLSDRTFALQTREDYEKPFISKIGALETWDNCLKGGIPSLDFFIGFSSVVGLLGNGGQTNYSSANTALDGALRKWSNSFTLILPAVIDGGGLASETRERDGRLSHLTPWGLSSQQICECLEDGLNKLADGPFWQYIPDLDWNLIEKSTGPLSIFAHLINSKDREDRSVDSNGEKTVKEIIIDLLDLDESDFDLDVPFTAYGLDSLSAARLSFALKQHVTISQLQLLSDISYNDLQARIEAADEKKSDDVPMDNAILPEHDGKVEEMEQSVKKYSRIFPTHNGRLSVPGSDVVLVTGTTGGIGTAVLANLFSLESVSRIYAFNRPPPSNVTTSLYQRQALSLRERGYNEKILEGGKIVLVEGDQSRFDLGISKDLFEEIRNSITIIIHNAWPVNFTSSLASLDPAIRSTKVFADLALSSPLSQPPRLLFVSSIGLLNGRQGTGAAAEVPIKEGKLVIGTGYTESKWVGERILQIASEKTPLRPIIVRVGQICGGENGSWNTKEWFPSLVKSAAHMGCLPKTKGTISWLPLDTAAKALTELCHSDKLVVHLSHPKPIEWSVAAEFISKTLSLDLVPYNDWLARLEASASFEESDKANPALRLLQYFANLEIEANPTKEALGLPILDIQRAVECSPTLKNAQPLTVMDVAAWIRNWEKEGFLGSL
ncbi:putative PKS-like protein biosynthetic cluster [Clathrus columnatus]|uniref:PKS-like protein biosynthetic cluster n=1 Tax=Clathrus columnatus TaxID=1419009 RepID=A0AAV5AMA6_9AGAM|nr:putative PKS-like protein biosynthetic cluster [Clathrus columnatus]